jgi:hypothetical protein
MKKGPLRKVLDKGPAGVMHLECGHIEQGRPGAYTPTRARCGMCLTRPGRQGVDSMGEEPLGLERLPSLRLPRSRDA